MGEKIKENEMGRAWSTDGEIINAYSILVGKPEGKRPLGRSRHRLEDIKMDPKGNRVGDVDWMHLAQDRHQQQAPVNMVMNLWVLKRQGTFNFPMFYCIRSSKELKYKISHDHYHFITQSCHISSYYAS
jgi:hypothetical protein